MKLLLILTSIICTVFNPIIAQKISGSGSYEWDFKNKTVRVSGEKVFRSVIAGEEDYVTERDMLVLDLTTLFKKPSQSLRPKWGGIAAKVEDAGKVTLSMYTYNQERKSKGSLIYSIYIDETSSIYTGQPVFKEIENYGRFGHRFRHTVSSRNILSMIQRAKLPIEKDGTPECIKYHYNWVWGAMNFLSLGITGLTFSECIKYYNSTQPIIVEMTIKDATVSDIKLPGLGEVPLSIFRGPKFGFIGDYGLYGSNAEITASIVKGGSKLKNKDSPSGSNPEYITQQLKYWKPNFIVSAGDDNYADLNGLDIDSNCGQLFSSFIHPYTGRYDNVQLTKINRFFPVLGNHDYKKRHDGTNGVNEWLNFFQLPNNERYYDFVKGDLHFFALNFNAQEPDGNEYNPNDPDNTANDPRYRQSAWLKRKMSASNAKFKIVIGHQPPYSHEGPPLYQEQRWPFKEWGADLVLGGHQHYYERNEVDGLTYVVNGLGGNVIDEISIQDGYNSRNIIHYEENFGAMVAERYEGGIYMRFMNNAGEIIDSFTISDSGESARIYSAKDADTNTETGNIQIDKVRIYPNPTNDRISIDINLLSNTIGKFEIFDLYGKKLIEDEKQFIKGSNTLQISLKTIFIPSGIYVFKFSSNEGIFSKRFILE